MDGGNGMNNGLPDLVVLNITFSNMFPEEGETVTICATIANFGTADAYNVSVGFFDQFLGVTMFIGDTWIDWIPWNPSEGPNIVYTCLDWIAGPEGYHTIIVEADYLHMIDELNEDNNIGMREIYVGPQQPMLPDLMVLGVWFSNPDPYEGEVIDICADVWNMGNAEAVNVTVHFYDQWSWGIPVLIGEEWIPLIVPGIPEIVCISWMAEPEGEHLIIVKVDPHDTIKELDEGNNEAYAPIWVGGGPSELPDLTVFSIWFSNPFPFEGELVVICADVWNIGFGEAYNVTVHFYDQWGWGPPVLIGEIWLPVLLPGFPELACIDWIAGPVGEHMIIVQVDPYDWIAEMDENNNEAYAPIWVEGEEPGLPDLTVAAEDISFSNDQPSEGETVTICATIHNMGDSTAYDVMVWFIDKFETAEDLIAEEIIISLAPGESMELCTDWVAQPSGGHEIIVDVDPLDLVFESDEGNNSAYRIICVCCGGTPYEIFVEAYTFDNDKDGKYDDVVIFVYDSENHMVEGADVYIDGSFFGKTPVSGTLIAYNFAEGWHDVSVYYETYHAVTTFYSEGL
jgi:subtilase family serine protease